MSETNDPRDFTYVSIGFAVDIRDLPNPFKLDTPFGRADTIGLGNIFDEADELRERVAALEAQLAEADRHAEKLEALLEPHIVWDAAPTAKGEDDGTAG